MLRTGIFFLAVIVLCLSPALNLKAQKYTEEQGIVPAFTEWLNKIEAKLDKLSMNADTNKEILQKLDLILSKQAEIKEELNTIKVRSTHR